MQIPVSNLNNESTNQHGLLGSISKLLPTLKKSTIGYSYKPQMSADELIFLLEEALNHHRLVTIQCNVSLYTENIYELSGYLHQINHKLVIINANTQISTIVWPNALRHIKFND